MKKSILIIFLVINFTQVFSQDKKLNNFFTTSLGCSSYTKPSFKDFGVLPTTTISYTRLNKYKTNFSVEYLYSVKPMFMSYYTNYINGNQFLFAIGQAFTYKNKLLLNLSFGFGAVFTYTGIFFQSDQLYFNAISYAIILSPKLELNYLFKNNSFVGLKFIYNNDIRLSNKSYNFLINFGVRI